MTKKILLLLIMGLLITACGITPEKGQSPEVVDKSGSTGMMDDDAYVAESGGPKIFVVDDDQPIISHHDYVLGFRLSHDE